MFEQEVIPQLIEPGNEATRPKPILFRAQSMDSRLDWDQLVSTMNAAICSLQHDDFRVNGSNALTHDDTPFTREEVIENYYRHTEDSLTVTVIEAIQQKNYVLALNLITGYHISPLATDDEGLPLMLYALRSADSALISLLTQHPHAPIALGRAVFDEVHLAHESQDMQHLERYAALGLSFQCLNERGRSPLGVAILLKDRALCLRLLQLGAEPDFSAEVSQLPIFIALADKDLDLLRVLHHFGATTALHNPHVKQEWNAVVHNLYRHAGLRRDFWPRLDAILREKADPRIAPLVTHCCRP